MTDDEATVQPAPLGQVERGVGRLGPERDQDGPRGTYGCACVSRDARECGLILLRNEATRKAANRMCPGSEED